MCNLNAVKNSNDYNFITISRFDKHGGLLIQDNVCDGMAKIAEVITNTANTFTDINSEVSSIVLILETNSDGVGFNNSSKPLSVYMYRKASNITIRISNYLNNYPGYINAIKKGFEDADKDICFVDSEKNIVKLFDKTTTTDCCAVTTTCERDNNDFDDNNPFYDLLGEIDCYNDDNLNANHIQHKIINDIKDLITGNKQVWNLKYDANIINDIRDLINECYKKVQND